MYKTIIKKGANIHHVKYYNDKYEFLDTPIEKKFVNKEKIEFNISKSDILSFNDWVVYFEIENWAEGYYISFKDISIINEKWILQTKKTIERIVEVNND